jgi:isopentenyl-diphosphate delta-isomerase
MIGYYDQDPKINKDEVASHRWMLLEDVKEDIEMHPELYTEWFKIIFKEYHQRLI